MFIIDYLPSWLFYVTLVAGLIGYAVHELEKFRPIAVALIFFSLFSIGYKACDKVWVGRVKELEEQIVALDAKKQEVNTKIVTKIITKELIVKQAVEGQIQYVDREIVKYNDQCKVPPEVITIHNRAVTP